MDITFLAIIFFIVLALIFLSLFLFKSFSKESFKAEDGSMFKSKSELEDYQNLYNRTKFLFYFEDEKTSNQELLGFDKLFITKLTREGFPDLKTVIKYRKQFKSLSDLINT
tara:strand:- start:526 stop:858 length:333 start_codon:yes stop_codon:yes gene_type:complete